MCLPMHPNAKLLSGHPMDCHCSTCLGPIVIDMRRVIAGGLGLCLVLLILWLVWIATPA